MKAIILAAGVASRLRPLTNNIPKCLLKIGDQSILERTINNLIQNGINDIVIVTGFLENQIKEFINSNFNNINVEFIYNEKFESTNNIYSLWLTKKSVLNTDIILLDSDIIFDSRIISLLLKSKQNNCLAIRSDLILGDEEIKVKVDVQNAITDISKEVYPEEAIGESIGIEKFSASFTHKLFEILDRKILIDKNVNQFYEAAFQEAIQNNNKIFAVDVSDKRCIEIDTLEDIEFAEKEIIQFLK